MIASIFEGFEVTAISKITRPYHQNKSLPKNNCSAYVDLASGEEAARATRERDGKMWDGLVLEVSESVNEYSRKVDERARIEGEGRVQNDEGRWTNQPEQRYGSGRPSWRDSRPDRETTQRPPVRMRDLNASWRRIKNDR